MKQKQPSPENFECEICLKMIKGIGVLLTIEEYPMNVCVECDGCIRKEGLKKWQNQ